MLTEFQVFDHDLSPEALDHYLQSDYLAVDTETMGLIPRRDRLCLVQLCDSLGHVSLVRIEQGSKQAEYLQSLMEAPQLTKIFHYARFDVAMLQYHLGISTAPIFCTKIASKLARTYSPKHGLKDVVAELVGKELDKSAQSSDWGAVDQLSDEQLRYASNDVRYLIPVAQKLQTMLKREGRWEIAQKCFMHLATVVQLDLLGYDDVFSH